MPEEKRRRYEGEDAPDLLDAEFDDNGLGPLPDLPEWWQGGERFIDQTPRVNRQPRWNDQSPGAVGQLVWTPSMIADYMRQTNAQFVAVNADFTAAQATGKLPQATRDAWNAFADSWRAFFKSDSNSWWGGTVDRAEDYRRQLAGWRNTVAQWVQPQSPPPHIEPSPFKEAFSFGSGLSLGAVVAIGLGLYILSKR